jgi:CheY-like chemotaxis protein
MKKILIADDEPHVLRVLKMSLEKEDYEVDVCANGMEALACIEKQAPDILITDIQMPLMTGEELCRHIEEYMPERKFLIFVLTSRTEIEHREWSRNIRNLLFLEKPVSIRNLVEKLEGYFAGRSDSWKVV